MVNSPCAFLLITKKKRHFFPFPFWSASKAHQTQAVTSNQKPPNRQSLLDTMRVKGKLQILKLEGKAGVENKKKGKINTTVLSAQVYITMQTTDHRAGSSGSANRVHHSSKIMVAIGMRIASDKEKATKATGSRDRCMQTPHARRKGRPETHPAYSKRRSQSKYLQSRKSRS